MIAPILLTHLLLASPGSADFKQALPGCQPGSYCQHLRTSSVFEDMDCAVAVGRIDRAALRLGEMQGDGRVSDEEFARLESYWRDELQKIGFTGRDQFDTNDVAAPEYLAHAHLDRFAKETIGKNLRAMREPELSIVGSETYRFLWLRSFHPPISVRVAWTDGGVVLVAKLLSGRGGFAPRELCARRSRKLTNDEAKRVRACFLKPQLWQPDLSEPGLDGATWIVEANIKARYSFASAWSPKDGAIRECGLQLLRLSGLALEPIY